MNTWTLHLCIKFIFSFVNICLLKIKKMLAIFISIIFQLRMVKLKLIFGSYFHKHNLLIVDTYIFLKIQPCGNCFNDSFKSLSIVANVSKKILLCTMGDGLSLNIQKLGKSLIFKIRNEHYLKLRKL